MEYDDTLAITKHKGGFWLYDTTRGMNLAMREPTESDAFFKSLKYYQKRLLKVEAELSELKSKVYDFVDLINPPEPEEY